jgi:hypothetical protein
MSTSNVHQHSLFVNVAPKYIELDVTVSNGVGSVPETEYYKDATAEYLNRSEPIEIINREFNISGTEPSEYLAESLDDLETIATNSRNFGDIAYILDGENKGDIYIINEDMNWVKQQ